MTEWLFWGALGFVAYAYAGYPMVLAVLARVRQRPVHRAAITPALSMIITARNEEAHIARKIEESLALEYPADRFELIVASDASTDRTHEIVAGYAPRGVRLIVSPERRGKEFAQKMAIDRAAGEILVFSDVATRLDCGGLLTLAGNFADPTVGCVSSVDRMMRADGTISGEGLYVRYEMWLRSLESAVGSVVGLSGSLFAARRDVCAGWTLDLPSDFTTLLNTLGLGLRGVSDPASVGYYPDLADGSREYQRKVRTITRGISSLVRHVEVLNPLRHGLPAWQIFSHKVCRWLVPFALLVALVGNIMLLPTSWVYWVMGAAQAAGYVLGALGCLLPQRQPALTRAIGFFLLSNLSIVQAWVNVILGRRIVTWDPSKRPEAVRP